MSIEPIATTAIDDVRHLLQRTGFAVPVAHVHAVAGSGVSDTIVERLRETAPIAPLPPPSWTTEPLVGLESFKALPAPQAARRRQALRKAEQERLRSLRAWWLSNLVVTDNVLGARMTLFWQNHFTSSFRKVRYAQLLYRQQQTLMTHAMGSFRALLGAMLADPALLLYLDNHRNLRNRPNENLARELLELFALGEGGGYTERDVREVARALSGRGVDAEKVYRFRAGQHDAGIKSILGERGAFDGDDVVEILLARPRTAEFIVSKLWRAFVAPTPPPQAVRVALGALFRASDYDLATLLGALLSSEAFWAAEHRGRLIKSPVEFVVGAMRVLELPPDEPLVLVRATQSMDMRLYDPPTVQGWPGGERWITSQTLLARDRFIATLLRDDGVDLSSAAPGTRADILDALLPADLHATVPATGHPLRQALRSAAWNLA